jgi:hypothetical protein
MNDMEIGKTTVAKKTTMATLPKLSETKYSENERKKPPSNQQARLPRLIFQNTFQYVKVFQNK